MNVERAVRCGVEQPLRQQNSVRGDHQGVGALGGDAGERLTCFERLRLIDLDAAPSRITLDWSRHWPQAAAGRAVGLRQDERNFMAGGIERSERALRELRGPGEDETQEAAIRPICAAAWRAWREFAAA
jgi:hypothetical protein